MHVAWDLVSSTALFRPPGPVHQHLSGVAEFIQLVVVQPRPSSTTWGNTGNTAGEQTWLEKGRDLSHDNITCSYWVKLSLVLNTIETQHHLYVCLCDNTVSSDCLGNSSFLVQWNPRPFNKQSVLAWMQFLNHCCCATFSNGICWVFDDSDDSITVTATGRVQKEKR